MISSAHDANTIDTSDAAIIPDDVFLTHDEVQEEVLTQLLEDTEIQKLSFANQNQDVFALFQHEFKRGGYFVDIGAGNGIDDNNTYLLEKAFGWKGLLVEPAQKWWNALNANRTVSADNHGVWSETGQVINFHDAEYQHKASTIALADLLVAYHAPATIDYLSINAEGSEYEILRSFDFNAYQIEVLTVKHNFSALREHTHALMENNGYKRVYTSLSQADDWYIRA